MEVKMKKLIVFLVAAIASITVIGCGAQPASPSPKKTIDITYTYVLLPSDI
jgi:hypothetical protein